MLGLLRLELDPVELGDAVDDRRDVAAKVGLEVVDGDAGVLHGIVEERCSDGDIVEAEVGDDPGDGEGVLDVRLARAP